MKTLGIILIIGGLTILVSFNFVNYKMKQKQQNNTEKYIEKTSTIDENVNIDVNIDVNINDEEIEESEEQEKIINNINYTAVLEIPKINLKQGVVDNTYNFNSLNYAISVDNSSKYPDENGNFILYAHAGRSSKAFFKNLNKVDINDIVNVYYKGIKYHYVIYDKYEINITGKAKVIKSNNNKYITLITCNTSKKNKQIVLIGKIYNYETY